jgi:hypothetical protein
MMPNEENQDRGSRFEAIAMSVRNRDAGRCRKCGTPEGEENLSVHHLIPDSKIPQEPDAHVLVNLVSLCRECHKEMESRSLNYQLSKLDIEDPSELMLSEEERQKLNNRLEEIGPNVLNVKTISVEESEQFLNSDLVGGRTQADLSDFQE